VNIKHKILGIVFFFAVGPTNAIRQWNENIRSVLRKWLEISRGRRQRVKGERCFVPSSVTQRQQQWAIS